MRATATAKRSRPTRGEGDAGASLVEFALVAVLLVTLVFGIINFGLLLSFKQDMTRAAAEGARAGAVAIQGAALTDAQDATEEAVRQFSDRFSADDCSTAGMSCTYLVADCGAPPIPPPNDPTVPDCVTVTLSYDYEHEPFLPRLPVLAQVLPDTIKANSIARVNP